MGNPWTPGPWGIECVDDVDGDPRIDPQATLYHEYSVEIPGRISIYIGSDRAALDHARLIAAAPEMAAILEEALPHLPSVALLDDVVEQRTLADRARALLARIRGDAS